jgi:uroporphyrinogen-III synthase
LRKNVLITRNKNQIRDSEEVFLKNGFNVIHFPVIRLVPLEFSIEDINKYDWIIFTSSNSVNFFFDKIKILPSKTKVAVVGSKTKETLSNYNLKVDILPKEFVAESLIEEFSKINIENKNILFPRALKGRDIIIEKLKLLGANVDLLAIYKNEINIPENIENILEMLKDSLIDYIIFTSPSTVNNFFKIINIENIKKTKYICIGPITLKELLNYTNKNYFVAEEFNINGIVNKILSLT